MFYQLVFEGHCVNDEGKREERAPIFVFVVRFLLDFANRQFLASSASTIEQFLERLANIFGLLLSEIVERILSPDCIVLRLRR